MGGNGDFKLGFTNGLTSRNCWYLRLETKWRDFSYEHGKYIRNELMRMGTKEN
jgi:hypothetical protein